MGSHGTDKERMCKFIKRDGIKNERDKFISMISKPEFFCRKCGRVCFSEEKLCRPEPLR